MRFKGELDVTDVMLFFGIWIACALLLFAERFFNSDGQIFQVFAGVIGMFTGALFTRIKSQAAGPVVQGTTNVQGPATVLQAAATDPQA